MHDSCGDGCCCCGNGKVSKWKLELTMSRSVSSLMGTNDMVFVCMLMLDWAWMLERRGERKGSWSVDLSFFRTPF